MTIIPMLALASTLLAPLDPVCTQATSDRARTVRFDSTLAFRGAGSATLHDGTFIMVWTGVDCVAWFRLTGVVSVDSAWQRLVVGRGAHFAVHEESPRGRRDYSLDPDGTATLAIDDYTVAVDSARRDWIDAMVREYVRRSGIGATRRATEILGERGLQALIEEATHIPRADARAQYLIPGFSASTDSGRATFLRQGSELLDSPFARTSFLLATPRSWRTDPQVLRTVYDEAARIEPDDMVERVLRDFPPPDAAPRELRESLGRLVATLQSSERRATLRALYMRER
jgi:hypothetical protein